MAARFAAVAAAAAVAGVSVVPRHHSLRCPRRCSLLCNRPRQSQSLSSPATIANRPAAERAGAMVTVRWFVKHRA